MKKQQEHSYNTQENWGQQNVFKEYISKPEINFLLSITIPLLALAVSWGITTSRLDHVEKLATALQDTYGAQQTMNQTINVKLAEIQKDILYIREGLDKHLAQSN